MLDGKIEVQTSATSSHSIRAYATNKRPNKNLGDEFVEILVNGSIRSMTRPLGVFQGNIALTVWCAVQADGTVKTKRVQQIIKQCQQLVDGKSNPDGYFFSLDPINLITPTTVNMASGYSTTVLMVQWHTTNSFNN